jgi:hypothetical protein
MVKAFHQTEKTRINKIKLLTRCQQKSSLKDHDN